MPTTKPKLKPAPNRTDDPHYQPKQAEMSADVSIRDATPEKLAAAVFRGGGQPTH